MRAGAPISVQYVVISDVVLVDWRLLITLGRSGINSRRTTEAFLYPIYNLAALEVDPR